ncbi:MAG: hypothetical protein JXA82_14345, partial [Sedimentisphaerales bacterium]|nr:hypothetical protein [Sedimentisphaerales bacterium]
MARVIYHAGKVLGAALIALFTVAIGFLTICSLVQSQEDPSSSEIISYRGEPVILSEIREELIEQRNANQRVWQIIRELQVTDPQTEQVSIEPVFATV